jgi:hypothetical protein
MQETRPWPSRIPVPSGTMFCRREGESEVGNNLTLYLTTLRASPFAHFFFYFLPCALSTPPHVLIFPFCVWQKWEKKNIGRIQRGHDNQETPAECIKSGLVGCWVDLSSPIHEHAFHCVLSFAGTSSWQLVRISFIVR